MATTLQFVEALCREYPEDASDLWEALEVLKQQRLHSCERLAWLGDTQWQRLGLPLGIEALLRDELEAALAVPEGADFDELLPADALRRRGGWPSSVVPTQEDDRALPLEAPSLEPDEGIFRRTAAGRRTLEEPSGRGEPYPHPPRPRPAGRSGTSVSSQHSPRVHFATSKTPLRSSGGGGGLLGPMVLTAPLDLEELWQQLLEDTLPPDKRGAVQATWEAASDNHSRYMMFLEYSSYLRRPEITEEQQAEQRRQLQPLMQEFGLGSEEEASWQGLALWVLFIAILMLMAGGVYCGDAWPDPTLDLQSL